MLSKEEVGNNRIPKQLAKVLRNWKRRHRQFNSIQRKFIWKSSKRKYRTKKNRATKNRFWKSIERKCRRF